MDHFYSGFLFLIVLQQGSGHDSPDSFISSAPAVSEKTLFIEHYETPNQTLFEIQDNFEQEFWPYPTSEPVEWLGDVTHFRIEPQDTSNKVLRLDSPFAGYSTLYSKQEGVTGQWRATVYQDFTPSNTNRTWFYLTADQPLESNQINGYALRFGESGTEKQIRLFRMDEGEPKEILRVPLLIDEGGIEVRVMRDSDFNWLVEARLIGEELWFQSRQTRDATHQVSQYSGFYFTYSSSRTDKFWIDDVDIRTAPAQLMLEQAVFQNQSLLKLEFNQPVFVRDSDAIHLMDSAGAIFKPDSITYKESGPANSPLNIHFAPLSDGVYELRIAGVQTRFGTSPDELVISLQLRNPFQVLHASFLDSKTIELSLSRFIEAFATKPSSFHLGGQNPALITLHDASTPQATVLKLQFDSTLDYGNHRLRIRNLRETQGWILRDSLYPVIHAYPPAFGDLLINEILFHPLAENDDDFPDQSQYIELYNTTPYPISAGDLLIHKGADELGDIRSFRFSCEGCSSVAHDGIIPPNGYGLIYPEPGPVRFELSRIGRYVETLQSVVVDEAGFWPFPVLSTSEGASSTFGNLWDESLSDEQVLEFYPALTRPLRYDAKTLSLTNGGSLLVLQKGDVILDSVYYSEEWHHQALPVHRGYALERVQPERTGLIRENWGTSAGRVGGTPGWQNSLYSELQDPIFEDTWLEVAPQPFSPNHDGFEDHLQLSYEMPEADYILRIRIYDLGGRVVKNLFLGRAGRNGSLLWDGRNEQGSGIPVGLYILLAQASGSVSGRDLQLKIPLVVAGAVSGR